MKLRAGIVLPESNKKSVLVPHDSFVPVLQADIGSAVSITVYRYRLLVPLVQIVEERDRSIRHFPIASYADLYVIRNTLIRHFGGVTVLHQPSAPALGVGARDPSDATSAPSRLNLGIEPLQLDPCFLDSELPIDGSLLLVDTG